MEKDFDRWNTTKKDLHKVASRPAFISEREIWWCALGINVGREQDGRGDDFERPVVVLKKLSPDTCMAVPLSTKKKLDRFQSKVTHGSVQGFALLDQIRVLDVKRMRRKIGTVSRREFSVMVNKLKQLL